MMMTEPRAYCDGCNHEKPAADIVEVEKLPSAQPGRRPATWRLCKGCRDEIGIVIEDDEEPKAPSGAEGVKP